MTTSEPTTKFDMGADEILAEFLKPDAPTTCEIVRALRFCYESKEIECYECVCRVSGGANLCRMDKLADRLENQEREIVELKIVCETIYQEKQAMIDCHKPNLDKITALTARAEQAEEREKAAVDLTAINIMRHIAKEDVEITKWNEPCVLCEHDYSDHGKCGTCDYDKNFELKHYLRGLPQDGEGK